jgi:hypothetical protein
MYLTTVHLAGLIAPLLGTGLSSAVGVVPALMVGSLLRIAGFLLMAILGVGKVGSLEAEDTPSQSLQPPGTDRSEGQRIPSREEEQL